MMAGHYMLKIPSIWYKISIKETIKEQFLILN